MRAGPRVPSKNSSPEGPCQQACGSLSCSGSLEELTFISVSDRCCACRVLDLFLNEIPGGMTAAVSRCGLRSLAKPTIPSSHSSTVSVYAQGLQTPKFLATRPGLCVKQDGPTSGTHRCEHSGQRWAARGCKRSVVRLAKAYTDFRSSWRRSSQR